VHALALALALLLPRQGALIPFQTLGGVRLGMTPAQVRATWGDKHGICRNCSQPTWYFTYKPFQPAGAAVSFRQGKVDAVWTLWSPPGWHVGTLTLGAAQEELTRRYAGAVRIPCVGYSAYVITRAHTTTAFYVYNGKLWGFGLSPANEPACR
jgi:hypothetical protein